MDFEVDVAKGNDAGSRNDFRREPFVGPELGDELSSTGTPVSIERALDANAEKGADAEPRRLDLHQCAGANPGVSQRPRAEEDFVSHIDGVIGRAMDELDLLAASRAQNPSMHSSSIVPSIGSEPSLTCSGTFAAVHGSVEGRLSSTPSSTLRAWVVGDYTSEMTNALVALGLRIHHIRRWQNLRWYNSGRLELLDEERPHLVLILAPKTMVKGKQAAKHCQKLADLILRQSRQGRHLAFYGNPVWPVWSPSTALSSGWREVLLHQSFFRTELRWCNMALSHPETGQGFWTKTLVLSSMRLWSGDGSPTACRCELGTDALGHAKTDDLHNDRFCLREQLWTKVNYYLVVLMLSGRP